LPYRYHRDVSSMVMSVFKYKLGKIASFYTPPIEVADGNDFDEGKIKQFDKGWAVYCPLLSVIEVNPLFSILHSEFTLHPSSF
jgi:hypothetical protein